MGMDTQTRIDPPDDDTPTPPADITPLVPIREIERSPTQTRRVGGVGMSPPIASRSKSTGRGSMLSRLASPSKSRLPSAPRSRVGSPMRTKPQDTKPTTTTTPTRDSSPLRFSSLRASRKSITDKFKPSLSFPHNNNNNSSSSSSNNNISSTTHSNGANPPTPTAPHTPIQIAPKPRLSPSTSLGNLTRQRSLKKETNTQTNTQTAAGSKRSITRQPTAPTSSGTTTPTTTQNNNNTNSPSIMSRSPLSRLSRPTTPRKPELSKGRLSLHHTTPTRNNAALEDEDSPSPRISTPTLLRSKTPDRKITPTPPQTTPTSRLHKFTSLSRSSYSPAIFSPQTPEGSRLHKTTTPTPTTPTQARPPTTLVDRSVSPTRVYVNGAAASSSNTTTTTMTHTTTTTTTTTTTSGGRSASPFRSTLAKSASVKMTVGSRVSESAEPRLTVTTTKKTNVIKSFTKLSPLKSPRKSGPGSIPSRTTPSVPSPLEDDDDNDINNANYGKTGSESLTPSSARLELPSHISQQTTTPTSKTVPSIATLQTNSKATHSNNGSHHHHQTQQQKQSQQPAWFPDDDDDDSDNDYNAHQTQGSKNNGTNSANVPQGNLTRIPFPPDDDLDDLDDFHTSSPDHSGSPTNYQGSKLPVLPNFLVEVPLALNHSEPDTARQGNDYDYFLNIVSSQPQRRKYFDLTADDIHDVFEMMEEIGSGGYSSVYKAVDKKTGELRAVKMVAMRVYLQHRTRMEAEAAVLGSVSHPAVVKFYGVIRTPTHFCFVMELLTGGELFDRIIERKYGYPEPEACKLVTTILDAVENLHLSGVVHRDIKPENFLFNAREGEESFSLKLIDFGFATFQDPRCDMLGSSCGTPDYIAPELLLERPHNQAVDLWSVGVVLYILLCGFPPFYAENDDKLFDLIADGVYDFPSPQWDHVSNEAKDLVSKLLTVDSRKRWTATQALNHTWIIRNNLLNSKDMLDRRLKNVIKS